MKPPPAMLPAVGWVTASAKPTATMASIAVPPSRMTSAPILDATSFCDDTIPAFDRVGTEIAPSATLNAADTIRTTVRTLLLMFALQQRKPTMPEVRSLEPAACDRARQKERRREQFSRRPRYHTSPFLRTGSGTSAEPCACCSPGS